MKIVTIGVIATLLTAPTFALAQDNTGGAAAGAVGGAVVGAPAGPVGAAVGAGVGAIIGSMLPSQPPVVYDQPVVVGQPLPDTFAYYPVPNYDDYDYVIIKNQKVIVDRRTHRVLRVID